MNPVISSASSSNSNNSAKTEVSITEKKPTAIEKFDLVATVFKLKEADDTFYNLLCQDMTKALAKSLSSKCTKHSADCMRKIMMALPPKELEDFTKIITTYKEISIVVDA